MTLLVNAPVSPLWAFIKEKITSKRILLPTIGMVLLTDILVLYFLPDSVTPLSTFMAYTGFILLGVWDSGAVTIVVGSIPLILDPELVPMGFSVYVSALALGLGLAPLMSSAIIEASPNYSEGYKNTYYLYFA